MRLWDSSVALLRHLGDAAYLELSITTGENAFVLGLRAFHVWVLLFLFCGVAVRIARLALWRSADDFWNNFPQNVLLKAKQGLILLSA